MSDAPVASQEAKAREDYEIAYSDYLDAVVGDRHYCTSRPCQVYENGLTKDEKWDALVAAIRASERERYAALVAAATEVRDLPMLRGESGVGATYTVTYKDTGVSERLEAALAALEEAGSA